MNRPLRVLRGLLGFALGVGEAHISRRGLQSNVKQIIIETGCSLFYVRVAFVQCVCCLVRHTSFTKSSLKLDKYEHQFRNLILNTYVWVNSEQLSFLMLIFSPPAHYLCEIDCSSVCYNCYQYSFCTFHLLLWRCPCWFLSLVGHEHTFFQKYHLRTGNKHSLRFP